MGSPVGSGMRRVAFLVVLVVIVAGCDWSSFGDGPAHTHNDTSETKIGVDNVATLAESWSATTLNDIWSSPAIAKGVLYVGSDDGKFYAFNAAGTGCSGTPRTCRPLWTAQTIDDDRVKSSPAVANGVVYVGAGDNMYAFDAAGTTNCSGSPKTCDPLWTTNTDSISFSSPAVANGVVYIGGGHNLYAYDAAGTTNCSGTPKVCSPLWTATTAGGVDSSPAVANGVVYIGGGANLYAYDAAGTTNCSGAPKVCSPLWTATTAGGVESSPAVANGVVYVGGGDNLYAYDAAGTTNCSGTPSVCAPLWTAPTGNIVDASPAVANGTVYIGSNDGNFYAFDAAGVTNCSGIPTVCDPLWTATAVPSNGGFANGFESSAAVANGVVYVGNDNGHLYGFDAAGSIGCSGVPVSCDPLWDENISGGSDIVYSSPAVANGFVYVGSVDSSISAFSLPPAA